MKTTSMPWRFVKRAAPNTEIWDDTQAAVLSHSGGPLLVLGGPGTGKTSVLAEFAARRESLGESVLVLARNRQRVSAIRNSVALRSTRATSNAEITTFHGLAWATTRRFWAPDSAPKLLTAPEQDMRLRQLLTELGDDYWPSQYRGALTTKTFAKQIRAAVDRLRQFNIAPMTIASANGSDLWGSFAGFFDLYVERLSSRNEIDYSELAHHCLALIGNLPELVDNRYSVILVDDFADAEPGQTALLQRLTACGTTTLLAFADPQQSLNSFRGTDDSVVRDFSELFPGGEKIIFHHNYRQAQAVGAACQQVATRIIPAGLNIDEAKYFQTSSTTSGGSFDIWSFNTVEQLSVNISLAIRTDHLERGIAYDDIAILFARRTATVNRLVDSLVSNRIPISITGEEIPLAGEPAVKTLLLGLAQALNRTESGITSLALSPIGGFDQLSWRKAIRNLRRDGTDLAEFISGRQPQLSADLSVTSELSALLALLDRVAQHLNSDIPVDSALNILWTNKPPSGNSWPESLRSQVLGGGQNSLEASRQLDAVCALFDLASREDWGSGITGVQSFLAEIINQQIPADRIRESRFELPGVHFSTVYQAAGREWKSVYVVDLTEGEWPNDRRSSSLFEVDRVNREGWIPPITRSEIISAERRLFYTAMSRASERLVICGLDDGDNYRLSRFVDIWPAATPKVDDSSLSGEQLVVKFRQTLDDESGQPALRSAAAAELRRLMKITDADSMPIYRQADPNNWWGIAEVSSTETPEKPVLKLTGSRVESLLACPRKQYLSQFVEADSTRSPALFIGSLIHAICEDAQLGDGVDWRGFIRENWPWPAFYSPYEGELELKRSLDCVDRYLIWHESRINPELTAEPAEAVLVEKTLSLRREISGHEVLLEGKIDRLEVIGERVVVYDLKTSKNKLSRDNPIESHAQLGFYQYLIREGGAHQILSEIGDSAKPIPDQVGGAQLVFLSVSDGAAPKEIKSNVICGEYPTVMKQESIDVLPFPAGIEPTESQSWIDDMIKTAAEVLINGEFPATPSPRACMFCRVKSSCPAVNDGRQVR